MMSRFIEDYLTVIKTVRPSPSSPLEWVPQASMLFRICGQVLSLEQRLRVTEERLTHERSDRANNLSQVEEKLLTDNAKLQVLFSWSWCTLLWWSMIDCQTTGTVLLLLSHTAVIKRHCQAAGTVLLLPLFTSPTTGTVLLLSLCTSQTAGTILLFLTCSSVVCKFDTNQSDFVSCAF